MHIYLTKINMLDVEESFPNLMGNGHICKVATLLASHLYVSIITMKLLLLPLVVYLAQHLDYQSNECTLDCWLQWDANVATAWHVETIIC